MAASQERHDGEAKSGMAAKPRVTWSAQPKAGDVAAQPKAGDMAAQPKAEPL